MPRHLRRDRGGLMGQVPDEHAGEHGNRSARDRADGDARAHERIACRIAAFSRPAGIGPFTWGGITFPAAVTKKVSG